MWELVDKVDADAVKTITEAGGHVSEPSPELHKFMQDAGKRSWKLFYDTVPNAKEILDSADSYRQAKKRLRSQQGLRRRPEALFFPQAHVCRMGPTITPRGTS